MNRSTPRILAVLTLAFGATILAVIASAVPPRVDAREAQQPLTVRQIYHQVDARLAESGEIYKAVIRPTSPGKLIVQTVVTQMWVDARRELAREQTTGRRPAGQPYSYTTVYANGKTYTRSSFTYPGQPAVQTAPAFTCEGAHIAASVILGCPNPAQTWTMSLQPGQYAGRQVLVLLRTGTDSSEGNASILTSYTTRIYLDRQTLLPLATWTSGITLTKTRVHESAKFVTSLVAPSSLPPSLFQPASIGYSGRGDEIRQEMKPVPAGFAVLWLGLDFAGGRGLPALGIQRAVALGGGIKTFSIELYYAPAKNISGTPLLSMEEWSSAAAVGRPKPPSGSGWTRQTVKLANGHAQILSGRGLMAFVYIGSTIALIEPIGSALSSVQALQTVVRSLRSYVPNR